MPIYFRRRTINRLLFGGICLFLFNRLFSGSPTDTHEIRQQNVLDLVSRSDKPLDVQRYDFLQVRMGRDETPDILGGMISDGVMDFWERFEKPYIMGKETSHMDTQSILSSIEQLLSLNGWVAALCPTLSRPFGQNKQDDAYDDLIRKNNLYYIGVVIHSADHFIIDQLAVIVQLAKRLGTSNLFVSMLDYSSTDSTETLIDLCEAVLTLLGIPFRIRRVAEMTVDPNGAYYPLEEAYMRNLALEPLRELYDKRKIKFHRVIWLKGFTCPNDILENIKVSQANEAAMVCGMDWAEHNGFFIFSDRWRTRDMDGDQFRQSKSSSSSNIEAGPPREKVAAERYSKHLPFQVMCCESGTHVVDPEQSYYKGISYRSGATDAHNMTTSDSPPVRDQDSVCLDSSQAWFCRDLWVLAAREGVKEEEERGNVGGRWDFEREKAFEEEVQQPPYAAKAPVVRRANTEPEPFPFAVAEPVSATEQDENLHVRERRQQIMQAAAAPEVPEDSDANAGSDYDAMPDSDVPLANIPVTRLSIPNSVFRPARILVNPRCVTTYAGVSHTQLALDLFGPDKEDDGATLTRGKYILEDWEGAPESFVCQEQLQTGGRKATKTQRRLGFSIHDELERRTNRRG